MKKLLSLLLLIVSLLTMTSCVVELPNNIGNGNSNGAKFELPEIKGGSYVEAIVAVNMEINLNPVYVQTNETLPGKVLGYGSTLKAGDKVDAGSSVDVLIAEKPANAKTKDDRIMYISEVCKLTGPDSCNYDDLIAAGIYGTDLGIPVKVGDEIIMLFGDSFSSAGMRGAWKSNFITKVTDNTYHDDLIMETIVNDRGAALPFYEGRHEGGNETDNSVEVTKIPTGGITIGDTVYIFYMSIRFWGDGGYWNVNYNGVVKSSVNDLKNWTEVTGLTWTEEEAPNFGQIYPFEDPNSDYIYLYGIPGGRQGGCTLGRTTKENFLNKNEYEYLVGNDKWEKGASGLAKLKGDNAHFVIGPSVSELSVVYNEYLGKYMTVFYRAGKLVMLTSDTPYSKFSNAVTLLDQTDYNGIYGGFLHPEFLADGGQSFYMTVSCWDVYNVYWVKVVLN